jgi:hypothetical protein
MAKTAIFPLLLSLSLLVSGQVSNPNPPSAKNPRHSKDEITVRGCIGRSNTDYILIQADRGNSYELEGKKLRLGPYLGQEVEVTGIESPTLSTSSDYLARRAATSVTITVRSIKTIDERCSGN